MNDTAFVYISHVHFLYIAYRLREKIIDTIFYGTFVCMNVCMYSTYICMFAMCVCKNYIFL